MLHPGGVSNSMTFLGAGICIDGAGGVACTKNSLGGGFSFEKASALALIPTTGETEDTEGVQELPRCGVMEWELFCGGEQSG